MKARTVIASIVIGGAIGFGAPIIIPLWIGGWVGIIIGFLASRCFGADTIYGSLLVGCILGIGGAIPIQFIWVISLIPILLGIIGLFIGAVVGPFVLPKIMKDHYEVSDRRDYSDGTLRDTIIVKLDSWTLYWFPQES